MAAGAEGAERAGRGGVGEGRGARATSDIRSEKTELIKPAARGRNSRRRGAEIKNVNLRDWEPQSRHGGSPLPLPPPVPHSFTPFPVCRHSPPSRRR